MKNLPNNWIIKETAHEVAETVCNEILKAAQRAIQDKGFFSIVLAGGTTPEQVYMLIAEEPCDWQNWHLYLGDERCLPANNIERNSQMIQKCLLGKVDIPPSNIHLIPAELGANIGASVYESEIINALPFDLVLLGMGEDGHTASLFPTHKHKEDELVHEVTAAPKLPSERVSLSVKALSLNHGLIIIVTGSSKQEAVQKWIKGEDLPVNRISSQGKLAVYLDRDAVLKPINE